jgi:hypothetical protein
MHLRIRLLLFTLFLFLAMSQVLPINWKYCYFSLNHLCRHPGTVPMFIVLLPFVGKHFSSVHLGAFLHLNLLVLFITKKFSEQCGPKCIIMNELSVN